jgi:hypothetical protein
MSRGNSCDFVRGSRARVNPCAHVVANRVEKRVNRIGKRVSKNCQILENLSGNIKIFPSQNPICLNGFPLSSTAFHFLQRLSAFFNGFLLSSMAFSFLQQFSAFLNSFLLSSTAFCFPQRLSAFLNGFPLSSTAFF